MNKILIGIVFVMFFLSIGFSSNIKQKQYSSEQTMVMQSDYATDFNNSKKSYRIGSETFSIWRPYYNNIASKLPFMLDSMFKTESINVEYDEVWEAKNISNLTQQEINQNWQTLDKLYIYFRKGQIQAFIVKKSFNGNPQTGKLLSKMEYQVTSILNRDQFLEAIE